MKYKISLGLTYIELQLSMLISLLIIIVLANIYLSSHKMYVAQEALNREEENAIYALSILESAIQNAGYIGCARLSPSFPIKNSSAFMLTNENSFIGTEHTINVRGGAIKKLKPGDLALISDCKKGEVVLYPHSYPNSKELFRLENNTYYVALTKRKNTNNKLVSALYMRDIHNRSTELIEDIDDVNFSYDLAENGKIHSLNAQAITVWSNVIGVKIKLTMSSLNSSHNKIWYGYAVLRNRI